MNTKHWIINVLLTVFLVVASAQTSALAATPKSLTATSPDRNTVVQILLTPCPEVILKHFKPAEKQKMKEAVITHNGKDYKACWVAVPPYVYLVDEEGDTGKVPMELFQPSEQI